MPEEGAIDKPDNTPDETPVASAVTYRPVEEGDIGNAKLKFYKKKADTDEPDLSTPVDATTVTAENMAEYVVENAAAVVASESITSAAGEAGAADNNSGNLNPDEVSKGVALARAIKDQIIGGGRRRSKRRKSKKGGARKSKKSGARKSKKGGRSRKNGSKRRAHRKH